MMRAAGAMTDPVPLVRLRGLSKSFGPVCAVSPTDLDVMPGDFCAVLGPSGCGKSTLLRMVGGFIRPTAGSIAIDGRDVTRLGPDRRPTNMVFQSYGLFPHLDVAANVGFGLIIRSEAAPAVAARVGEMLELVRLGPLARRAVQDLSGGQQQRVALARALIMRPRVLLLDEPLAALDLKLRQAMQDELRRIHRDIGGTFIFVTHDQTEAFALATRIVVMNGGRLEQVGPPDDVYLRPQTAFVADFVGEANILRGRRDAGRVRLAAGAAFDDHGQDGAVAVVIRPERVSLAAANDRAASEGVVGTISDVVFLGHALKVEVTLGSGEILIVREGMIEQRNTLLPGLSVRCTWLARDQRVVEAA